MNNEIINIDTNNYEAMAKAMGMSNTVSSTKEKKSSSLARFRINHTPIMGTAEVNGKQKKVEVVEGGTYKLEIPDGPTHYASGVIFRPHMQRLMFKKFVPASGETKNRYVKTIMSDDLNVDLKDNDGGFNCGRRSGFIEDFSALPESDKELIRSIKRVRVVLGTANLVNPTDETGAPVDVDITPCIWEIENREAFTSIGGALAQYTKAKRLFPQHNMVLATEQRNLPNGGNYYVPVHKIDMTDTLRIEPEDQVLFGDFMQWVLNYNDYILNAWSENVHSKQKIDVEVESFVDVEDATV